MTVKELNWEQFYIVDASHRVLAEGKDAQLVITIFGTADFSAIITDRWLASSNVFVVAISHDTTILETIAGIGGRYWSTCGRSVYRSWSSRFDPARFDAVNAGAISASGSFTECP
jgi:hypothetical protein